MNKKIPALIINGNLGAGKTAVGKILAERLSFKFLSSGNFFREEAVSRDITFDELHKLMIEDSSIDKMLDERLQKFLSSSTHYVIDSRMAAFFEPGAFKVFLSVDPLVGAERIFDDIQKNPLRHSEASAQNVSEVLDFNIRRAESEKIRYQELYGFNHLDTSLYDLVLDTSASSPEDLANEIEEVYKEWIRV
jgi:cytidylate kinase